MLRSSLKWASQHEFVPVEETPSSVEQGNAPQGFQELLVRLVKAVLINKPLCIYQCLAATLEAELDRRTLWEIQFSQYSRSMPTSSRATQNVPFHLLPSTIREVGDASDILHGKPAIRNLASGLDDQELAVALGCFPNSETRSLDPEGLKPFLAFEFPHGTADATRDEMQVVSLCMPQNSTLLTVKTEGRKHLPGDSLSTTASGVIKPELGELRKDGSAADIIIDLHVLDSNVENIIIPTTEYLLRSHNPFASDGDQDELQDRLNNWQDDSLKDTSQNEDIDSAAQDNTIQSHTQENSLHMLDTKSKDTESRGSGLVCDSSDRPSYIPRGDRLADAMLHFDAETASVQDLELHDDVAAVASSDHYADAVNKFFARYIPEADESHSVHDSCIVQTRYDGTVTASNPDIAVLHETSETTVCKASRQTMHGQDSIVKQSRDDVANAADNDESAVQDEPQTEYPENSNQDQDVLDFNLTSETEQQSEESVRDLEEQEYRSSSYIESAETDEFEYSTPPNESFKQSKEEFQEEDEFHTPRAMFPEDLVLDDNVETSPMSVHVLHDKLLVTECRTGHDEGLATASSIEEMPQSNGSTQNEGVTTESVAEGFPLDEETTNDKEINDESVIQERSYKESKHDKQTFDQPRIKELLHSVDSTQHEELTIEPVVEGVLHCSETTHDKQTYDQSRIQQLSYSDDSTQDGELPIEPIVEGVLHGKESKHDKQTYDQSRIQELSHSDDSTPDEELTIEPVVEGVLQVTESKHDNQAYDQSQIQELSHSDNSTQGELTIEPVFEGVLHGKESKHDKQAYDQAQIQELFYSDDSTRDEELTIEPVIEGVLHGKESKHDKQTYDQSQIQELSHSDDSTQDEELTIKPVIEGVLHGKESKHDKQAYDQAQIQEVSHGDDSIQDEELTIEPVVEGVLHGIKSKHGRQIYDQSQIQERLHSDDSTQDEEIAIDPMLEGVLHGKESKHDKQTYDQSQIQEVSHSDDSAQDDSTQDEELTIKPVIEGVLHGKDSKHDKQAYDQAQIQELFYSDDSTQDEELTIKPVIEGVLHGIESIHDRQDYDQSQIQELWHSDDSTPDEELIIEPVIEGVLHGKESKHGKQDYDQAQIQEVSHSDDSTQDEELTIEPVVEGVLHGIESKHDRQIYDQSRIQELFYSDDSDQNEELTIEPVIEGVLHGKESKHDKQTYDQSQIQELWHSDDSTSDEELIIEPVIEGVLHGKESKHGKQDYDQAQIQEVSHRDDSTQDEELTIEPVVEGVLQVTESKHDNQAYDQSQIQELSHSDNSTQGELTIEPVFEGVLHGKESKHDKQAYDQAQIQELFYSDDSTRDEELTIEPVIEGVLHGKESKHDKQTYDQSQIQELSHSDDSTQDEELTIKPVIEGVLHGKESKHDKQAYDQAQIQEVSHGDDSIQDEELTIEPVVEGVLHGIKSKHGRQIYDQSQIQERLHSDDSTQDEEIAIDPMLEGVLHGKESKHDKQTYDQSQIQEVSHSDDSAQDDSTQDEELTIKPVIEGVLHGKDSKHDKQAYDQAQIQELFYSDDSTQDEELTIKPVIEGVLHGKESKHDKQAYDQAQIQEVSHGDDSTQDEELTIEPVVEGVLRGIKSKHGRQIYDQSQIQELLHSDDSTQDEEIAIDPMLEGVLHGKESKHDKQTYDQSQIQEVSHSDDSAQDDSTQDEELTIKPVIEGVLHGKDSKHDKQAYDQAQIQELFYSDDSTQDEELTIKPVIEGVLHGIESIHDRQDYDQSQIQELWHSDDSTPDEELIIEPVIEGVLHGKESKHGKQDYDQAQIQEVSHSDDSTQDEELTIEPVVEGVLHGIESKHDRQIYDQSRIQELFYSDDSDQNEELTIEPVIEGVLHGKESKHDKQTYDQSQIQELWHSDDSTSDEELIIEPVIEGVLHGKESKHGKQDYDQAQIQEVSHRDDSTQDEELTIEPVVEGVLHGIESKHDRQIYDQSWIQELFYSDDSDQNEELTMEPVIEGVLHGKGSKHDKQAYDQSQIQELSHSDDSTQDEELTIEPVVEGALLFTETTHDKQTYDESQIQELSHSDDSTQDEELTIEPIVEGVLSGKESKHDKQTYDQSQIQELSHSDDSTEDEELTIEPVFEGVLYGKEPKHDKQAYDQSQIQELSHSDDSTQDEELTIEPIVEGVLHGEGPVRDMEIIHDLMISEIRHSDELTQGEGLTSESVVGEFHVEELANGRETSDELVIHDFPNINKSRYGEQLTSSFVVKEFANVKGSTLDKDMSDSALNQGLSPSDDKPEAEELKPKTEIQEFPNRDRLLQESIVQDSFLQEDVSAQNEGFMSVPTTEVLSEIEESPTGKNWMSEEFGEFQSNGISAHDEDLKSSLGLLETPQGREPTCGNEVITSSVCGEEITVDSVQAKKIVNESSSKHQITESSADETEMQTGSSLEDTMLDELMLNEENKMHASLMAEEMNFEIENDKEVLENSASGQERAQKMMLQLEEASKSVCDEENPTFENVKTKFSSTVCFEEMTLKVLPDEEMIHEAKQEGEEVSPDREHTRLNISDLDYSKDITCELKPHEEIYEPENAEIKSPVSFLSKDEIITSCSLLLEETPIKSECDEMMVSAAHCSNEITQESLRHEVIQPESENSEVKTPINSVYGRDMTSESPHDGDAAAEDLQTKTQESSESVMEAVNPDENSMTVKPVKEPLFYAQNVYPNFSHASESDFPSVANKPTMSEEKTAYMLEWDEMNLGRRESDVMLHTQCNSSEHPEQDDSQEKEECESSVTESESDTATCQPSVEVTGDHPDCFSSFSFGPSLGRESRIRLKWYSISTSCSDVLEEEDEEDESNVTRGNSTLEVEAIQDGACNSQTLQRDDVNRYGEELTQNHQSESMAFDVTESELTNAIVTAKDSDVPSEWKNVDDAEAAVFPSVDNTQELTLGGDDQNLGILVKQTESSTNSRVLPEHSKSLAVKMVTKIFGEDIYSNLCEKKLSTGDSLYLSETFTGETGLLGTSMMEKTEEIDDDQTDIVQEYQDLEETNQLKSALDVDTDEEIQMDETVASGKHSAEKTEDETEKAGVLEDSKDAQMITEVIDDRFTAVETKPTEHCSSKTGSFEQLSAPGEADKAKTMHRTDIDDALCLLETETLGKEGTNTVHSRDSESLAATDGDKHKIEETESNTEDVLRIGAVTIDNFSDEAIEMGSVIDETGDENGMREMSADEFQSTGRPEIQLDVTGNAEDSWALDSAQKADAADLQHISLEPGTEAKFKEKSTEEIEPEEINTSFESGSNLSDISSYQTWFSHRVGIIRTTEHSPANFQLFDKDSEETDMNKKFEKDVDHPATNATQLDSHKNQGMRAERNYYETITPEKAILFFSAAPGQSNTDSEEMSAVEGQGEEISPVYSTDMPDTEEAKDVHEHIVIAASMHGHADIDEANLVDKGDRFLYVNHDKDGQESEPKFLLDHPSTRSQWEYPFEKDEIIIPQKVDLYSAIPTHRYHGENDSESRDNVDFHSAEETNVGISTTEESSCDVEDESAVNDQPLNAPVNCPAYVFSFPLDVCTAGDETKLNDHIALRDESSTSKSCRTNEPLEHEEASSEWPPLPQFLAPLEEYTTSAGRQSIRYRDDEWMISMFNPGGSLARDLQDSEGEEASIYWTESINEEPCVADSVSLQNPSDKSDVAAEVHYSPIQDRFETRNNERLRAFFNAQTLENEDWPPLPEFAIFHNESDGTEGKDDIVEALSATKAIDGTTGGQMSVTDLSENQLLDSSELWPPLPNFLIEELISGGPRSSPSSKLGSVEQIGILPKESRQELDPFSEGSIYGANICTTEVTEMAPSTLLVPQTDNDEASSEFFNEDKSDDQRVNEYLELSVVSQLVFEIVSSARQSVLELTDRNNLISLKTTPTEAELSSEPKESTLGFCSESPLLLDVMLDNQIASGNEFASDSEYEEASIYWTQPPILMPPVTDNVSLQSPPDNNAPETCPENTRKTTGPENNDAGFEVRQFCAVASSAFTDLTKVTGSQGDMKSHHNIQSHIELGVTACQSWSDLDILPCGSSKSLQLIGAPELSSWVAGSDEANRKWREDEQVGRRQSIEAESQSAYTEGEAIRKVMETEGVDSGFKIEATEEPLLGCRRDSTSTENERGSRDSSVHIWMPVEEEGGLHEKAASKGVVAKGSEVMELPEKALEQQSSDVAEHFVASERTAEPSRTVSTESSDFADTTPILVPKDCSTVMKSPDADDCGNESDEVGLKEVPDEYDFGATFSSASLLNRKHVSDTKKENICAGIRDMAERSGGSTWEFDLNSVMQLQQNDPEAHSGEFEEVEKDDVALGLINESVNLPHDFAENKLKIRTSSVEETKSDVSVPTEQTVDLHKPIKQTETSSVELIDPTGISASETGLLAKQSSNILQELGTEITTGSENWLQMDQSSVVVSDERCPHTPKMSDVQEIPISYDLEAQQEVAIKSSGASDEITELQELSLPDPREPQLPLIVLNQVSCALCKTDRTAMSGYPDTAATPLSEPDNWIQMGHTWLIEDEMLASAEPSCTENETLGIEEETNCLGSYSSKLTAADEITVCKNRTYSPIFEKVETPEEEVKQPVSAGIYASLTQVAAAFKTDETEACNESASTISFIDSHFHLSYSPQVVEVEDTNVGLDQDDRVQDDVDEIALGVQEHHFELNESTCGEKMEDNMFCDTSKSRVEQQYASDTVSVQLDLNEPDDDPVLNLGDSIEVMHKSGLYSTDANLELADEDFATGVEESDPSSMQRMPPPVSSGAELGLVTLCPRMSSNQLESEAVDNSNPSASLSMKEEDEDQKKYQEEKLVEEEQLSGSSSDKDHNEDEYMDQIKNTDMGHCKNQDENLSLAYGAESDADHIKENDEFVEPIPPHSTKSETDLVFSLHENRANSDVEPVGKGSTHPMSTGEEVVTIIPVDVLDQSPPSPQGPSISPVFLIASQQGGFKIANLEEQKTIRSSFTDFESESKMVTEEQDEIEQGLSDDGLKTYSGTTSLKAHVGTVASTSAEGIVQSNVDAAGAPETHDDKVVSKSDEGTFASNATEEIFILNIGETRASETEEGTVVSKGDGLNASKTDDKTDSSETDEAVVASKAEEVESSSYDERNVLKDDNGTTEPYDDVITSENDNKTVIDGAVSPKP